MASRRSVLAVTSLALFTTSRPASGDEAAVSRATRGTRSGAEKEPEGRPVAYVSESGERWSFDRVGYGRLRGGLQVERLGDGRLRFLGDEWRPVYE